MQLRRPVQPLTHWLDTYSGTLCNESSLCRYEERLRREAAAKERFNATSVAHQDYGNAQVRASHSLLPVTWHPHSS